MAKKKASKQKKMDVRVDFTPMVDMMMLLITFFMLCTSLSKPQAMQLTMPSNDQNLEEQDKSQTKASETITLFLASDNKIYYVQGEFEYENPECLKETTWGSDGIRKVLLNHTTGQGINPVARILAAKAKLDAQFGNKEITEEEYKKKLEEYKKGNLDGEKVNVLTVIIKPMDTSTYENMVSALDEMQISCISKYVIDKISPADQGLLDLKGVK